ncbi:apolipoprotein N-acyltransferase [Ichthyobacterium seriolicida]|uniref:Apolipoprotein N-acyltransferase n=1 Tax=Ichthyobacterium seriolicida TaxID=242600 RepID=A0A1J1DXI4_9FLAO|nr:apolipoprotein N-acyltransferase [Ichthyobacterium seriolicida]BAV94570.1 apolipoprotein N-acyltransferase [Ichthyobacterium seriolicida]
MKKATFLSLVSGLALSCSWPTYGLSYLIFFSFVPLLLAIDSLGDQRFRTIKVFGLSYISLFIWNLSTTYWLFYSTVIGAFLTISSTALFMSIIFVVYSKVKKILGYNLSLILLVMLFICYEKLQTIWDLAWPWLNLGNVFSNNSDIVQWYEYTGSLGGSLWIWVINVVSFKSYLYFRKTKQKSVLRKQSIYIALCITAPIIISHLILSNYEENGQKVDVCILQPNIDSYTEKFNFTNYSMIENIFDLVKDVDLTEKDYLISPETSLPNQIDTSELESEISILELKKYTSQYPELYTVIGITSKRDYNQGDVLPYSARKYIDYDIWYDIYNSAIQLHDGDSIDIYHKSKLVPGVEILPFSSIVKPIIGNRFVDLGGVYGSLGTQDSREVFFNKNGIKVAPIICYESVFGQYITEYLKKGAELLFIVTNDGWWSDSQGHKQHLAYSKIRAIENRRSIARSANTGISAIINQKGEIVDSLPYGERGVLEGQLHINKSLTFYSKNGDYIARIALLLSVIIILLYISILLKMRYIKTSLDS